ncbi:MAG TPA: hypothetical protein VLM40_18525 [Gemmata sp.]|nr:hypothetical protein [Gemmata sp.]
MLFRIVAGTFALSLLGQTSIAEDKKDNPATTIWERETNGVNLTFEIGKDTLKGTVLAGDNGFVATCKIEVGKDGIVKAKVTDVEVKDDTAELSDLTGDGVEDAKPIVEGEYKKRK